MKWACFPQFMRVTFLKFQKIEGSDSLEITLEVSNLGWLVGDIFGQMAKNCMKMQKLGFFAQNIVDEGGGKQNSAVGEAKY